MADVTLTPYEVTLLVEGVSSGLTVAEAVQEYGLDEYRTQRALDEIKFRSEIVELSMIAHARKRNASGNARQIKF